MSTKLTKATVTDSNGAKVKGQEKESFTYIGTKFMLSAAAISEADINSCFVNVVDIS